jgi:molecular chaperone Hsp33
MRQDDHLIQAASNDGSFRILAAVTTELAAEACRRHRTSPTASAALGRALSGTLLLGASFKDLEYVTVRFVCKGPIGGIVAEANSRGTVRGYVRNPGADVPLSSRGKLDVGALVGPGMLHVIREAGAEIGFVKEPYQGSVPLVSGEIAEDLTHYLATSEQINSAVALGVFVDGEGEQVTAAGGYIIQVMPGADEDAISALEARLAVAPHVTDSIRRGGSAELMLLEALGDLPFTVLNRRPVAFECKCSYDRAIAIVTALGKEEVTDMLDKDRGAELTCHFCNQVYFLDEESLMGIIANG